MPPPQPRQNQRNQHTKHPLDVQALDCESDAHPHNPPPSRTNTDLNLSVLRRYRPSIRSILSIAANAVVYQFAPTTGQWDKSGMEGTLFVCDEEPDSGGDEGYCIVVLNRRGLENLVQDIGQIKDVEMTSDFLILRLPDAAAREPDAERVVGLWIHEDKDDTREKNAGTIIQCWEKARAAESQDAGLVATAQRLAEVDPAVVGGVPAAGRRISLTNLFTRQQEAN